MLGAIFYLLFSELTYNFGNKSQFWARTTFFSSMCITFWIIAPLHHCCIFTAKIATLRHRPASPHLRGKKSHNTKNCPSEPHFEKILPHNYCKWTFTCTILYCLATSTSVSSNLGIFYHQRSINLFWFLCKIWFKNGAEMVWISTIWFRTTATVPLFFNLASPWFVPPFLFRDNGPVAWWCGGAKSGASAQHW